MGKFKSGVCGVKQLTYSSRAFEEAVEPKNSVASFGTKSASRMAVDLTKGWVGSNLTPKNLSSVGC